MPIYFKIEVLPQNKGFILVWAEDVNSNRYNTHFMSMELMWGFIKDKGMIRYKHESEKIAAVN